MFRALLIFNLAMALLAAGCNKPPGAAKSGTVAIPPAANPRIYPAKGVVVELKPSEKSVGIKHEAVPGYMGAMTMLFEVKDMNELNGLEVGDPVAFRMIVTDTNGWIDQIRKIGPKTNILPTTGQFRLVRDVEPLSVGDPLPEYHFTNQLGQAFSTAQFKGQALAVNFLFTRCPYPTFCPLMANDFAETQKKLLAMQNGPTNWHLLTISFDPEFDTPSVLKAYAEAHEYNPRRWTFATGELIDITAIGEQFGLAFWHDQPGGLPSHNLRTAVIDASGRVQKVFGGNQWTPDELVAEMVKAAKAVVPRLDLSMQPR